MRQLFLSLGGAFGYSLRMRMCRWVSAWVGVWTLVAGVAAPAQAQLRILDYNVAASGSASSGPRAGMDTVLRAIGDQTMPGFARPIDIMLMQEGESAATTARAYANLLNTITAGTSYLAATVDGLTTGGGRPVMVYNSASVTLLGEQAIGTVGSTVQPRQTMRYQFRPVGYDASADFYVYNSHMKSSSDSTSQRRRDVEAANNRADADALGEGAHVIYVGDWNLYTATEAAFQTMQAGGAGQAVDPISQIGSWSGNATFKPYHTQSPATTAAYGGQVTGGLNDRFDFQMVTGEWLDGRGLDYIPGSYWAFGNTATHALSGAITTGSAAALQALLPGYSLLQTGTLLTNLSRVTDHLPVVADYQLPAKMGAGLSALPSTVIRGAAVAASLTVSNDAPVTVVRGADRLDYAYVGSGIAIGSGTGADLALDAGNSHAIVIDTSAAGAVSGTVSVVATSPQAASPTLSQSVGLAVLDHAIGSFSASSTVTTLDIDFGLLTQGAGPVTRGFSLFNRAGSLGSGWTAALDLDAIVETDPAGVFSSTLSPFLGLASGSSRTAGVSMLTTTTGSFSGSYLLDLSDIDLPGATSQQVTLTVRGAVAAPATVVLDVAAGAKTQAELGFAAIGGASSVTKTGSGTAMLDATNSYTGMTTIAQGVLAATGSSALGNSSLIDVAAGAVLDFSGMPGAYTVSAGQTIAGQGVIQGSVVFGRGSTLSPGLSSAVVSAAATGVGAAALPVDHIAVPEPAFLGPAVTAVLLLVARATRAGRKTDQEARIR